MADPWKPSAFLVQQASKLDVVLWVVLVEAECLHAFVVRTIDLIDSTVSRTVGVLTVVRFGLETRLAFCYCECSFHIFRESLFN